MPATTQKGTVSAKATFCALEQAINVQSNSKLSRSTNNRGTA